MSANFENDPEFNDAIPKPKLGATIQARRGSRGPGHHCGPDRTSVTGHS